MDDGDENNEPDELSSSPCSMRAFSSFFFGGEQNTDILPPSQVKEWRKQERQRLIAERLKLPSSQRRQFDRIITGHIGDILANRETKIVAIFWPFRGEPNLLSWIKEYQKNMVIWALPVVETPKHPLVFRSWSPGKELISGVWGIPVPLEGAQVVPDVVIAPVVGFDQSCFRLGYGGGYYDRTLAQFERKPTILGVGYAHAAIPTIHPQSFDIPMDYILTERGVHRRQ